MSDDRRVSGTVSVEQDSKYRVALDLAKHISFHEEMDTQAPRRYWLELYQQCLSVVNHHKAPESIRERPQK
jgi:hypothetical protein